MKICSRFFLTLMLLSASGLSGAGLASDGPEDCRSLARKALHPLLLLTVPPREGTVHRLSFRQHCEIDGRSESAEHSLLRSKDQLRYRTGIIDYFLDKGLTALLRPARKSMYLRAGAPGVANSVWPPRYLPLRALDSLLHCGALQSCRLIQADGQQEIKLKLLAADRQRLGVKSFTLRYVGTEVRLLHLSAEYLSGLPVRKLHLEFREIEPGSAVAARLKPLQEFLLRADGGPSAAFEGYEVIDMREGVKREALQ